MSIELLTILTTPLTDDHSAGNGSLMRLAPVAMFYALDKELAIRMCGESSRTTHGAQEAIDACRFYGSLLVNALNGLNKSDVLNGEYESKLDLCPKIAEIARGKYKKVTKADLKPSGYVVDSLLAALWAVYNYENYEDIVVNAVNLGGDADTIGAIAGMLAGALYPNTIPQRWLDKLVKRDLITNTAQLLFKQCMME